MRLKRIRTGPAHREPPEIVRVSPMRTLVANSPEAPETEDLVYLAAPVNPGSG
jgi:hypothetical protein